MTVDLKIQALHPALGAEVVGLDLAETMDDETMDDASAVEIMDDTTALEAMEDAVAGEVATSVDEEIGA